MTSALGSSCVGWVGAHRCSRGEGGQHPSLSPPLRLRCCLSVSPLPCRHPPPQHLLDDPRQSANCRPVNPPPTPAPQRKRRDGGRGGGAEVSAGVQAAGSAAPLCGQAEPICPACGLHRMRMVGKPVIRGSPPHRPVVVSLAEARVGLFWESNFVIRQRSQSTTQATQSPTVVGITFDSIQHTAVHAPP